MGIGDDAESLLRVLLKPDCDVYLDNNPWECPPAAVVAAGNASIRGYYDELKGCEEGPVEMRSLKIVLAGHSGAGKTRYAQRVPSCFSRYNGSIFRPGPSWPAV